MAFIFITFAAFLYYSTSKYFPYSLTGAVLFNNKIRGVGGFVMMLLGIFFLAQSMSFGTALIVLIVILMTVLPLVIFSLTIYPKSWIGWAVVLVAIALIDLFRYAS